METGRLLVVNSGAESFRSYALRSMGRRAPVALLTSREPSWEREYIDTAAVVDFADYESVRTTALALGGSGILTYDESLVELTARLAADLGLRHATPDAVGTCKDKSRLRARLRDAGLSPVRFAVAHDAGAAAAAAEEIGYPVVLKPLALGGSAGVVRVDGPGELGEAFELANGARIGSISSAYPGALVEELLVGPEFSVDCVTFAGTTTPVVVAEKMLDLPPYFEEVGHVVPAQPSPALDAALELVVEVHQAVGLDDIVTHTEFRLTPSGPRIIELNARAGGDLIPYLGFLANGVDLAAAAADVALGRTPDLAPRHSGAAAVRFFYPTADVRVEHIGLRGRAADYPGLERFVPLAGPGDTLLLPPRGFLSRLAAAVVTGEDREQCRERLSLATDGFECRGDPGLAEAS